MLRAFLVGKTTLFAFAAIIWVLGAVTCGIYGVQLLNEGSDLQGTPPTDSITHSFTPLIIHSLINPLHRFVHLRAFGFSS